MRCLLRLWIVMAVVGGLGASADTRADVLSAVQLLRESGCGGLVPRAPLLHHDVVLDRSAQRWALGELLSAAVTRIVLAPSPTPEMRAKAPVLAVRALQLINDVRARGARCGGRSFSPTQPVTLSETLAGVASAHAADMAEHDYFEHEDLAGRSPADRVRASGYREKLVGENIAYGPTTVEEVVQGWLDSPGHCENIMDSRFGEMGIGYAAGHAPGHASGRGLYWVQLLAAPRT